MKSSYDFVVIGGGSAGYAAAAKAIRFGLSVAVIEGGREVGGLCILRGCMPSKTLIESANRFITIQRAKEFGLRAEARAVCGDEIIARKRSLIQEFSDYRREQLESGEFQFIRGFARFADANSVEVHTLEGARMKIAARAFLIATGSKQQIVQVPGLEAAGFLDSDAVLDSTNIPESVIVLGGGSTALEFAHYYSGLGVKVTLVQRSAQVLKEMDEDVVASLVTAMGKNGVRFFCGTRLVRVEKTGDGKRVHFEHEGVEKAVQAAEIINALGRTPATEQLGLRRAGIATREGVLDVNLCQQTSVPHIFAAGDAAGPYEIVHVAIQQAEVAACNAAHILQSTPGPLEEINYRLKLSVVFTQPEVAVLGLSERELKAGGRHFMAASHAFADHGKALVIGEPEGFVKLIVQPDLREILGAAAVGPHASELIHEIAVAMHFRATAADLLRVPHYHPTLSEIWTYPAEQLA